MEAAVVLAERKLGSGGPNLYSDLYFGGIQIATYIRGAAILYKHQGLRQIGAMSADVVILTVGVVLCGDR